MIHGIYNYDGKVLWTNIRVENDTLVTGYRITNGWARTNYTYFAMSFSKPVIHYGCEEKAKVNYRGGYGKFNMKEKFPGYRRTEDRRLFRFRPGNLQRIGSQGSPFRCEYRRRPEESSCGSIRLQFRPIGGKGFGYPGTRSFPV